MTIITPRLGPQKGRWPKNENKRALRRYQLEAAAEYARARKRRDGSQGAASPVRIIDPRQRQHLTDPVQRNRAQLETEYLTKLMKRDARIWRERTAYETGGVIEPDELDGDEKKQDGVQGENGQQPNGQHLNGQHSKLLIYRSARQASGSGLLFQMEKGCGNDGQDPK